MLFIIVIIIIIVVDNSRELVALPCNPNTLWEWCVWLCGGLEEGLMATDLGVSSLAGTVLILFERGQGRPPVDMGGRGGSELVVMASPLSLFASACLSTVASYSVSPS